MPITNQTAPARGLPADHAARALIQRLGADLDRGQFPVVFDGGYVSPGIPQVITSTGLENCNAESSSPETSISSAEGPPTGSPGTAAPVERPGFRSQYEAELGSVANAYPDSRGWSEEAGMWLRTESAVLPSLQKTATFLTAFSWPHMKIKSWAAWRKSAIEVQWIGPRHTNFPDGSICAFEPGDIGMGWSIGDPLVQLIDLYTVWALRHLHLELLGRWPGPQSVVHPFERRTEFQAGELCGCGTTRRYEDCCRQKDARRQPLADAVSFAVRFAGGTRSPPRAVLQALCNGARPPTVSSLVW
jgi:hypothetical protein